MNADVLVIGAGVAGLACAREFTRLGRSVVVLDRANGVGGRCASRTLNGERVDYGVPFLHGGHPHFLGIVEELAREEPPIHLVAGWPHRVNQPRLACQPEAFTPGQRRMGVREGVSALPKRLARGVDIRLGCPVTLLHPVPGGVEAVVADGRRFRAPRAVLALAAPQAHRLFEPLSSRVEQGRETAERLLTLDHIPCLTVVAGYGAGTPEPPYDIWYPLDTTILYGVIHESAKRPAPDRRVLVLQARRHYSAQFLEAPEGDWTRDLVWEAGEILGPWAGRPEWTWSHRWRWSRLTRESARLGHPAWLGVAGGGRLGLCGEAFSAGGGVEGAFLSGVALARESEGDAHV